MELSDLHNILCIVTNGDTDEDLSVLVQALIELAQGYENQIAGNIDTSVLLPNIPTLAMTPRKAFYADTEVIPFEESAGRVIAEFVMVYPPGIPIFIPGEIITEENLDYTRKNIEAGLPVQGAEDDKFNTIRVIKDRKR